ncbi:MAG: putative toxin-antitoxin system toxin component, PIN family [Candidatus Hadarchaeota archaeon]|nr:putative toxin-antitoxin system toxin component, PIN family [Candidatus Hadarchaeota archaeon]
MRVCLDTNILVSAALLGGNERKLLELARKGKFKLVLSAWILSELEEVLRTKIGISDLERYGYIYWLREISELARPTTGRLRDKVAGDSDRKVVGTAVAGSCRYLVTGDKELLRLGKVRNVEIIKTTEALLKLKRAHREL